MTCFFVIIGYTVLVPTGVFLAGFIGYKDGYFICREWIVVVFRMYTQKGWADFLTCWNVIAVRHDDWYKNFPSVLPDDSGLDGVCYRFFL